MAVYGIDGHILTLPDDHWEAVKVLEAQAVDRDYRNGETHWRLTDGQWLRWHRPVATCIRCSNANWVLIGHSCGKSAR